MAKIHDTFINTIFFSEIGYKISIYLIIPENDRLNKGHQPFTTFKF